MFGIDQQIARLETLTCEMSRKLDRMIALLERITEQQQEVIDNCTYISPNSGDTFTVTIDELDAFKEFVSWTGQDDAD